MSILMTTPQKYTFTGHETFPFRYGWLKKGVDAVNQDPYIFTKEEALVVLGVGKNMVRSIRHWCLATQLIEEDTSPIGRGKCFRLTPVGKSLLEDSGWDPYLEDPASLWLIHFLLVSNPQRATTWSLAFGHQRRVEFSKKDLLSMLQLLVETHGLRVTQNTLKRDIDCFLRTYVDSSRPNVLVTEETFDCPLTELGLIQSLADGELFRFDIGPKNSLPVEVFGFAFLQYFKLTRENRRTMAIHDCLYSEGSPGQIFKLDENTLIEYLERLAALTNGSIQIDETAGLKQIYRNRDYMPFDLLNSYYVGGNG